MENFRRSLKYLWPYRSRIAVAILCVIFIASLWGGGLGLILPGSKILMSDEGLHGWAYQTLTQDHLGAKVAEIDPLDSMTPEKIKALFGNEPPLRVLTILSIDKTGPATQAQLNKGTWILGLDDKTVRGNELLSQLAQLAPLKPITLKVYSLREGLRTIQLTTGKESPTGIALKYLAVPRTPGGKALIPEPKSRQDRFPLFLGLLALIFVVTLLRALFTFIQEYMVGTAIWMGVMDLRCENYNKVLHLPVTFFSQNVSDTTSRFIQDTNELARGQNTLLGKTMVEPAKAVVSLALALWMAPYLTLMVVATGPIAFWFIRRFGKQMHRASKQALHGWSLMLTVLVETLQGIRVVKAYTMEGSERKRFFQVNRELLKQQMKKERLDAITGPTIESLGIAAGIGASAVAGYLVFVGYKGEPMDQNYFVTWMAALFALFDPVRKLAKVSMRFNESDAAAKRVFELLDATEEPHVLNAPTLPKHHDKIVFEDVSYRYPKAAVDSVKCVNLTIPRGKTVAVVGPNGSGKTTLLSLLPRLLDPTSGRILIDGMDTRQVSVRSLRRQIGLVTQDTVLFHATIADNIAYGLRRPHQETVLAAARKAFVDEFVRDLPEGYNTMVGEHGTTLSGGQKQRISIARAILRDPAIMIFDEAMSQVDSDSERRIHEAMVEFIKGRTTLTIAHRFATVMSADMIVVMAEGAVIDVGTHAQLLDRCQLYGHLYQTQFNDSLASDSSLKLTGLTPAAGAAKPS